MSGRMFSILRSQFRGSYKPKIGVLHPLKDLYWVVFTLKTAFLSLPKTLYFGNLYIYQVGQHKL
jgi:hypothetical protein